MNRINPRGMLKGAALLAAATGLFVFFALAPILAQEARRAYPEAARLYWPGLCFVWGIGALCYWALWHVWRVAGEIGRDNSFSQESADHLRAVGRIVAGIGAVLAAGAASLLLTNLAQPGFLLLFALGVAASAIVAMVASALSRLVRQAAFLKAEVDLTI